MAISSMKTYFSYLHSTVRYIFFFLFLKKSIFVIHVTNVQCVSQATTSQNSAM